MFTKEYPYLLAGLPELTLFNGEVKAFSLNHFIDTIREHIAPDDAQSLRLLLLGFKENSQTAAFYLKAGKSKNKFIRDYFAFDRDMRNLLAGAAARKMDLNAMPYIIGENNVTEAVLHSKANDFGLSSELDFMPALHAIIETQNVLEREQKLDMLRWSKADELTTFNYLDINKILAFIVKAHLVDRWLKLDKQKGEELLKQLVTEIRGSKNTIADNGIIE